MFTPPRLANTLLRWILPGGDAEAIAGDLEEIAGSTIAPRIGAGRARRWYWRQVLSIANARMLAAAASIRDDQPERATMAALGQDLLYALRALRKQPAFTALAVIMLGLGLGANVAIFAVVNAVLLKPLPYTEPDRLMVVHLLGPELDAPGVFRHFVWSYPKYEVFRQHQRVFESTAAFGPNSWNMTGAGNPERTIGELVEATYFDVLGVRPALGRSFSAEETLGPGSEPVVMLGHGVWTDRFGADPGVIGRTLALHGISHTIVGVLPPGFRGLTGQADLWVPITTLSAAELGEKWNHSYTVVARRLPGVTVEQADAATRVLGGTIDSTIGRPSGRDGPTWAATAVPLDAERTDPLIRRSVLLLLGAVVAVLLIVCINLANLMLVRTLGRQREVAIRAALGASRVRIVRQFLTETAVLAIAGAATGLAIAWAAVSAAAALMPDLGVMLPRGQTLGLTRVGLDRLGLDLTTLVFTSAATVGAALLFGLVPAWRASRRDLSGTIKVGSPGAAAHGTKGFSGRNLLVVCEMALALVLLTGSGLMLKSVVRLQATELGFRPDSLLSVRVGLPMPEYDVERGARYFEQLLTRLGARPGIESAAYGSCAPLAGPCNRTLARLLDRPAPPEGGSPLVGVLWISPSYFDTLGIRLVRGRGFTEHDRVGQPNVVVVNETGARTLWPNQDPIGKRVSLGQGGFQDGAEVIGVVADVRYAPIESSVISDFYLPMLQSRRLGGVIFTRSGAPAATVAAAVRQDVQALDGNLPITDVKMMEERFSDATWRTRLSAWLLGVFAALAMILAALGTYGVMSQGVEQRRMEIGVRIALGAARSDIFRLIIGRVVIIAAAGIAAGVALAVPAMKLLTALLYQVRPGDPWVFAALALILLSVTLLAGYIPARRATRVDPLTTLRAD